jgi:hypothetical protein
MPLRLYLLALLCYLLPTLYCPVNVNIELPDHFTEFLVFLLLLCPPASSERQVLELLPANGEAQERERQELWQELPLYTAAAAAEGRLEGRWRPDCTEAGKR